MAAEKIDLLLIGPVKPAIAKGSTPLSTWLSRPILTRAGNSFRISQHAQATAKLDVRALNVSAGPSALLSLLEG